MAKLVDDPESWFKRNLDRKSRVLLLNPPVQERRYHWLRWNQPLELLRLSSWLKLRHPGLDVRLDDAMLPDADGVVPKHKVKDSWLGETPDQLWHFGQPFEEIDRRLTKSLRDGWVPDCIVITSLTSYWHQSIDRLLPKLCMSLGKQHRKRVKIVLYGNYPRFEPQHAARQRDPNVAMTRTVRTDGCPPDAALYLEANGRLPAFFALDVCDDNVYDHLAKCLELQTEQYRKTSTSRRPTITVAFFNDDVCSPASKLEQVVSFAAQYPAQVLIEGIAGIEPRSLSPTRLEQMKAAGFRTLFVEHARREGGGLDEKAYAPLLEVLRNEEHAKRSGLKDRAWLEGTVTGFVGIGRADDKMDDLVRSTLLVNSYFNAVILKPYGYSPTIDDSTAEVRVGRWRTPRAGSPQWFPYVGHGSSLSRPDYDNLLRWQNVLNMRVKGTTFDFLAQGNVAKLVRETLVAESWKPEDKAP